MPTLNWLGREKTTDDLRQVALRILREDRALSHLGGSRLSRPNDAEVRTGGMPHAENAESAEAGRAALVAVEGCAVGGMVSRKERKDRKGEGESLCDLCVLCGKGKSSLREEKDVEAGRVAAATSAALPHGILVHGDNLEALKALLPFYAGEVKCIYVDPPYNTGSAFEHYDDNLEHATWLNMMYPRLKLLREFLREDGSIWISIDDREGAYLRVICDEIFGRQNFYTHTRVCARLSSH